MGERRQEVTIPYDLGQPLIFSLFSLSLFPATLKPPDVTCIPKVRSIQMIVHPTFTPIRSEEGRQLTLQDIFNDLSYRLELRINHTYQTVISSLLLRPPLSGKLISL